MKKFFSIILCMTGLLALCNCSKDEEVTTGTISGLVSDITNSNTAIPGTTVTLSPLGLSKTTGSDGRYEFTDIEPGKYTLSVNANNYQTDTKSVTVYTGQVVVCDFQLSPTSTPVTISPLSLSFGPANESLTFTLTNQSNRSLQYNISGYPSYLTVTPSAAQVAAKGTQTITVNVNRGAITSNASTQLTVNVGNDSYPVNININSLDLATKMAVSPTSLNFGTSYTTLQFSVRNVGTGGDLSWSISTPTDASLRVSPTTGVTAMGNATPVTVTLDRSKLSGDITAFINVNTNGGAIPVTVTASKSGSGNENENGGNDGSAASVAKVGLQAYYTFDDETGKDITENELNGVLANNPNFITDTPNGRGKAIHFNTTKSQTMNIPYNPFYGIVNYSVSVWVKDCGMGTLFGCLDGNNWAVPTFKCTDKSIFSLYVYDFWNSWVDFNYNTNSLYDDKWHMVTMTKNANTALLYIDGSLVDRQSYSVNGTGGMGEGTSILINCDTKMDNLRLYNRMLTADDVKAIYNAER